MSDKQNSSIYASVSDGNDSKLHMIVINKNFDDSINATFDINSPQHYVSGRVWAFDDSSSSILEITPIDTINGNSFSYNIPSLTVCHIVLEAMVGDLHYDGRVDFHDFAVFASAWGSSQGDDNWNPACDLSQPSDNVINELDLAVLTDNWLAGL